VIEAQEAPFASGIFYLFADRFVGTQRFGGEKLAWRGVIVSRRDLANQLVVSAFAQLTSDGCLRLELEEPRTFLGGCTEFLRRATYGPIPPLAYRDARAMRTWEPRKRLCGLEAAIWENITRDRKKNRVTDVVHRIIRFTAADPWGVIVETAKEGLAEQGYLVAEREVRRLGRIRWNKVHWCAKEELIAPHEAKVPEVKAMPFSFEAGEKVSSGATRLYPLFACLAVPDTERSQSEESYETSRRLPSVRGPCVNRKCRPTWTGYNQRVPRTTPGPPSYNTASFNLPAVRRVQKPISRRVQDLPQDSCPCS